MNKLDKKYMQTSAVYQIVNLINGRVYIGSSVNVYSRYKGHINDLKNQIHHSILLQRSFNKYGLNNFYFNIIEIIDGSDDFLREREQFWIDFYQSYNPKFGFNMSRLSTNGSIDVELKKESAKSFSKQLLCYDLNGNFIREFSSINEAVRQLRVTGVQANVSGVTKVAKYYMFKEKISDNYPLKIDRYIRTMECKNPELKNERISKKLIGIKKSEISKEKNRQAHLGKKNSEETRAKLSAALKGKPKKPQQIKHFLDMVNASKRGVNQIDIKTSKILNTFNSLREASDFLNVEASSSICGCCKGVYKTAYGFKWEYCDN